MKKILLFGGNGRFLGGWDDFLGSFSNVGKAHENIVQEDYLWWEIVDLDTKKVIDRDSNYESNEAVLIKDHGF